MVPILPRWVWRWGALLPAVSGATNAIALMALHRGGVTHLTGVSTEAAIGIALGDAGMWVHALLVIAVFVAGCVLSACLVGPTRWQVGPRHRMVFMVEAVLLAMGALVFDTHVAGALVVCAFAMGLQNGLSSVTTGALLRTTHLTGMLTDLGTAGGLLVRGEGADGRRMRLSLLVCTSFVGGALGGALLFRQAGGHALLVPSCLVLAVALAPASRAAERTDPSTNPALPLENSPDGP